MGCKQRSRHSAPRQRVRDMFCRTAASNAALLGLLGTTAAAFAGLASRCATVPHCATYRAALPRAELSDPGSEDAALQAFLDEGAEAGDDCGAVWLSSARPEAGDDCEDADGDTGGDAAVQAMLDAFLADGGRFEETADVTDEEAGIARDDLVNLSACPNPCLSKPQPSPGPDASPGIRRRQQ